MNDSVETLESDPRAARALLLMAVPFVWLVVPWSVPGDIYSQSPCYWCGDPYAGTTDHLTPRSRGGTDDRSNLVNACHSCNARKGAKTEDEYRRWLATR